MLRSCRGHRKKEKRNELGMTEQQHLHVSFIVGLGDKPSTGNVWSREQLMEEAHNLIKSNENTLICIAPYYNIVILGEANCSHSEQALRWQWQGKSFLLEGRNLEQVQTLNTRNGSGLVWAIPNCKLYQWGTFFRSVLNEEGVSAFGTPTIFTQRRQIKSEEDWYKYRHLRNSTTRTYY